MSQQHAASSNPTDNRISNLCLDNLCFCYALSELNKLCLFRSGTNICPMRDSLSFYLSHTHERLWECIRAGVKGHLRNLERVVPFIYCTRKCNCEPGQQDNSACDRLECKHGAQKDTIGNDSNGLGGRWKRGRESCT